jgi:hypothetical protein
MGLMKAVDKFNYRMATNFPPMPLGGYGKALRAPLPIKDAPFAFLFTWLRRSTG